MKKIVLFSIVFICLSKISFSQTATVTYSFYVDANNNCVFDNGEQIVFPQGLVQLSYVDNSGSIITTSSTANASCQSNPLVLNNYSLTPTNTLTFQHGYPYTGVITNSSCSAYHNLPYNTNTYLPLKSAEGLWYVGFTPLFLTVFTPTNYTFQGNLLNDVFTVCGNLGNDPVTFEFSLYNNFGCSIPTSSRTYSLYLDGSLFSQITSTGSVFTGTNSNWLGNATSTLVECYNDQSTVIWMYTKLPQAISSLNSHTFTIKSSLIYNNPLATLNYSCVLRPAPCTKISGKFYNDCNNNCVMDVNENGLGYGVQGKLFNSNGTNIYFNPDNDGNFSLAVPSANSYSITQFPVLSNFTACNTTTITLPAGISTNTLSFGYLSQSAYQNTSHYVQAWNNTLSLPGTIMKITYKNNFVNAVSCITNTNVVSGTQKIILSKFLSYVNTTSGPPPTTIIPCVTGDTLVWVTSNFTTLASGVFSVAISPTVSLLSPFRIDGYIYPSTDHFLADNLCSSGGLIGAPFDPNSKEIVSKGLLSNGYINNYTNGQELNYTINFQNVGTAPAVNVKSVDTIDVNLDLSSIKILGSSHPVRYQVDNVSRQVTFMFDSIYLSDATSNEAASHGYVRYLIKLNNGVPINTFIKNRAFNYFDYTSPVATNQTKNKLVIGVGVPETTLEENGILLMPNPFEEILNVSSKQMMKSVKVFNLMGQLQYEINPNALYSEINFASYPPAIYFVSIQLDNGVFIISKVIKN